MKYPELSLEMARKVCDGRGLSDREIQYLIDWPEEEYWDSSVCHQQRQEWAVSGGLCLLCAVDPFFHERAGLWLKADR